MCVGEGEISTRSGGGRAGGVTLMEPGPFLLPFPFFFLLSFLFSEHFHPPSPTQAAKQMSHCLLPNFPWEKVHYSERYRYIWYRRIVEGRRDIERDIRLHIHGTETIERERERRSTQRRIGETEAEVKVIEREKEKSCCHIQSAHVCPSNMQCSAKCCSGKEWRTRSLPFQNSRDHHQPCLFLFLPSSSSLYMRKREEHFLPPLQMVCLSPN